MVPATVLHPYALRVLYGSQTGTARKFAEQLVSQAKAAGVQVILADLKDCDPEDTLTHEVWRESIDHHWGRSLLVALFPHSFKFFLIPLPLLFILSLSPLLPFPFLSSLPPPFSSAAPLFHFLFSSPTFPIHPPFPPPFLPPSLTYSIYPRYPLLSQSS